MTGLVWLVCSSDGVKFTKIRLFCCLYASFAVDFHGLFKTIFKMKSFQQFFGGFYDIYLILIWMWEFWQKNIAWNNDNYMYAVVLVVTRDWNQTAYVSLKLYANIKGAVKSLWYFPLKHS